MNFKKSNIMLVIAIWTVCLTVISNSPIWRIFNTIESTSEFELIESSYSSSDRAISSFVESDISSSTSAVVESSASVIEDVSELEVDISADDIALSAKPKLHTNSVGRYVGEFVDLPNIPTYPKLFTDFRCYNLTNTPHYRLQQSSWTDENGLRRYNEDYIVGLGTSYTVDIGDRFEVVLDNGYTFTIILGDNKANCDTDVTNRYTPYINYEGESCANVLEFIIDKYKLDSNVYAYGSVHRIEILSGNIISMQYIGRDESDDWDTYVSY